MLEIKNLHAYYGAIEALKGINLTVPDGKIVCLIGANGAGKTTTLKSISGMVKHTGSISFNGEDITALRGETLRQTRRHTPQRSPGDRKVWIPVWGAKR